MDLTTSTRVKALTESGGISAGTANDTLIAQLIATHSQNIENYLGRKTLATSRTEQFDVARGQRAFLLSAFPVTEVTSARDADDRDFASALAIDTTDYYLDTARGVIEFDGYQPINGAGTLQVIYTGGMAADTASFVAAYPDVAQACDMQVAYTISRKDQLGAQSIGTQSGSVGWAGPLDLLPEVKRLLEPYRRVS